MSKTKAKKNLKIVKPPKAAKKAKAAKTATWKPERASKKALSNVPRTPRDRALPGMEDAAIQPLEEIGAIYADIRDQRQRLTREEASLKESARALMHKHGKTVYRSKTIEIVLHAGAEDIKVKVRGGGENTADASNEAPGEANTMNVGADTEGAGDE